MQVEAGSKVKEMRLLLDASRLMLMQAASRVKQLPVHPAPLSEQLLTFWVRIRAFLTLWCTARVLDLWLMFPNSSSIKPGAVAAGA